MGLFKKKLTFEELPEPTRLAILHINAEFNLQHVLEKEAIRMYSNNSGLYHRAGGDRLFLLHILGMVVDKWVSRKKNPVQQIQWIDRMYEDFHSNHRREIITDKEFYQYIHYPEFITKRVTLVTKWLTQEKGFEVDPSYRVMAAISVEKQVVSERLLKLLWGTLWNGHTDFTSYSRVLVLLHMWIIWAAHYFQNPPMVERVLDEHFSDTERLEALKREFLEYLEDVN